MKITLAILCMFILGLNVSSAIDGSTDDQGIVDIERNDRDAKDKRAAYVYVVANEMSRTKTAFAKSVARRAVLYYNNNSSIARYIRSRFDSKYVGNWHCVVGKNYGFSIRRKAKHYIFFRAGSYYITVFRSP